LRARAHDLDGLLSLPTLRDATQRRTAFRQGLATLARSASASGPSPLEGVPPDQILAAVRTALDNQFFEDLDWLSPAGVGVALYELGTALPSGPEQRDLGRRVLLRLHAGTAETFATIATRMVRSTRKGPFGAAFRARVSLVFSAPPWAVNAGPLAYAFVTRRELAREWIAAPSSGPLPARRLAARMIERAAMVAARRALSGDEFAARVFGTEAIARPFARLLADREPLVWRHAAVARGLLAGVATTHFKATVDALHPRLTPTEWRRGAVSLVTAIATAPDKALARARDLLRGPIVQHDPGIISTMALGLPRALDLEPEAAEELLDAMVDTDPRRTAEGIAQIAREVTGDAGKRAILTARAVLSDTLAQGLEDPDEQVLTRALARDLEPEQEPDVSVRDAVQHALQRFVDEGAREAHAAALEALEAAKAALSTLEGLGEASTGLAQRTAVLLLRDLDQGIVEEPTLSDLLTVGVRDSERSAPTAGLVDLQDRLGRWLLGREHGTPAATKTARASSGRRLRALLHLLDAEDLESDDDARSEQLHARRVEAATTLLARLVAEGRSPLHRTLCATLARVLDALVREGACDPVDVMMVCAGRLDGTSDVITLAEASMQPDVEAALSAWARFTRASSAEEALPLPGERLSRPSGLPEDDDEEEALSSPMHHRIDAVLDIAAAIGDDGTGRGEALRAVLVRFARALEKLDGIDARSHIPQLANDAIEALPAAAHAYAQIEAGARLRVLGAEETPSSSVTTAAAGKLSALLSRLAEPATKDAEAAASEFVAELRRLLPPPLVRIVADVLDDIVQRSFDLGSEEAVAPIQLVSAAEQLPAWLGSRRTLGGFYIVRPLGSGAASSVFVAKRTEERHDPTAETFALKVPDYDGSAAAALSEEQFLAFFRAEASALLGLPADQNLARFVTFDLAARPKPILVMELIEGPTLERFVEGGGSGQQGLTCGRAFAFLDGVLSGLETMHRHAIAHLDLKPSNVVLRQGQTPCLVDFGLAGRVLRPGCATGNYGAPEIWGVSPEDLNEPSPLPADVYAFGAVAYEVLTGQTLFDGPTTMSIVSKHLVHDGNPEGLDRVSHVRPLTELLRHTLRHDPRDRWTVPAVRAAMRSISRVAGHLPWPLSA